MGYLFLSYCSNDSDLRDSVVMELEDAGYTMWYDQRSIKKGHSYQGEIKRAIDGCDAVVLLLTHDAEASRDVRREVSLADHADKPIIPLARSIFTIENDDLCYILDSIQITVLDVPGAAAMAIREVIGAPENARVEAVADERALRRQRFAEQDSLRRLGSYFRNSGAAEVYCKVGAIE